VTSIVGERCQREEPGHRYAEQNCTPDFHRGGTKQGRDCERPQTGRGAPRPIAFATLPLDTDEKSDPERDSPRGVWMIEAQHWYLPSGFRPPGRLF
jgi:hypothetical protein